MAVQGLHNPLWSTVAEWMIGAAPRRQRASVQVIDLEPGEIYSAPGNTRTVRVTRGAIWVAHRMTNVLLREGDLMPVAGEGAPLNIAALDDGSATVEICVG